LRTADQREECGCSDKSDITLTEKVPDIKCLIIGDVLSDQNLEKIVSRYQIEDNVIFKGFMKIMMI